MEFSIKPVSVTVIGHGLCEKLVSVLELEDLEQAYDEAIRLTQIKYRKRLAEPS